MDKKEKKSLTGVVVSNKMQKTVVVSVDVSYRHPMYGKKVKRDKRIKARSENSLNVGDNVRIEEYKPLSQHVSWIVVEVLEDGK